MADILSNFRYSAILLVACFSFLGCNKEKCAGNCIEIHGRVGSEAGSAVAVAAADIQVSSIGNGSSFFSAPEIYIQRVSSNAEGFYSITFSPTEEMRTRGSYQILYSKKGYGDDIQAGYSKNLRLAPGDNLQQNLHLPLLGGSLRIRITGFSGGSATNNTYLMVYSGRGGNGYAGIGVQPSFFDTATGQPAGTSSNLTDVTCQTAANQYAAVLIYKVKGGVQTVIRDSIYCPQNTPVTYQHAF